ncbi:tRNA glutamyl-Q(34) synthetase GluQRS [Aliidiomarina minuta]|uniref:Glutamyl-Q tRNA(Asp) synthetase n=1 Tax=Aliidiomarina minuta TaxID=880057 RepID=A0A432W456_9GAMM|nr:tRNA glutamyl-Q(34) synthetase GluQRS [Aliidiomarina minuta]RUO24283.1 tRNA glutamyl-Q(34) synthetase GluQRS [Aliidiomarina minuta]
MAQPDTYRGRFAPSPSGPLHAGSLVAALGSYLDARAKQGEWLLRIEDIDPPRQVSGAADAICSQLEAHHLHWDQQVSYQSQHHAYYQHALENLWQSEHLYYCDCTRKQIKARAPFYTGYCRERQVAAEGAAIRLKNDNPVTSFYDRIKHQVMVETGFANEDFVVRRRDGLWAYQLAVVVDDMRQGITHIVRGADLLTPSAWQLTLWQVLAQTPGDLKNTSLPQLMHLPLVTGTDGLKLSKQNHAPALDSNRASDNLEQALAHLNLTLPNELKKAPCDNILAWAIEAWSQLNR